MFKSFFTSRLDISLSSLGAVRAIAALVVLISVLLGVLMGEVINRDGILYVSAAQAFLDGGVGAAIQVYKWPAYSIIFGFISKWTGLSLEASAHLLNAALMLLLVDSFIRLSHCLMGKASRPWLAALVLLSFPPLDHRLEIYRDWGYLAFSLFAFVSFLKFWLEQRGTTKDALIWQAGMLGALLFRVEAAALIVLLPLALLFQDRPWSQRVKRFMRANFPIAVIFVVALVLVAAGGMSLGRLSDITAYVDPQYLFGNFTKMSEKIASHVLNKYTDDYAGLILGGGIATVVGWMLVDNLGGWLVFITGVGLYRNRLPESNAFRLVYWALAIIVVTLSVFLVTNLVSVSRYALLGSLFLLTLTVYAVTQFSDVQVRRHPLGRYWWWFILTGLVIGNLANLALRPDYKGYLREGGNWLHDNVSEAIPLITNDSIIEYYAQRQHAEKLDSLEKIASAVSRSQPPYVVALKTNDKDREEVFSLMRREPMIEFHSSHARETLLIFEVGQ